MRTKLPVEKLLKVMYLKIIFRNNKISNENTTLCITIITVFSVGVTTIAIRKAELGLQIIIK